MHKGLLFIKVDSEGGFVFSTADGRVLEDSPSLPPAQTTIEEVNAATGVPVAAAPWPGEGYPQHLAGTVEGLLWSFGLLV